MDENARINELINISEIMRKEESNSLTFFKNLDVLYDERKEVINKADSLLFDLKNTPHAFVLACVMDLGVDFELAWIIPYKVITAFLKLGYIKNNSIDELSKVELEKYRYIFCDYYPKHLHRYNYMSERFLDAILLIKNEYHSNASNIWVGKPSAGIVARRFELFDGVGPKISTMAAKLLGGKLKIEFSSYSDLDIPIDRHVIRVMKRMGLIKYDNDEKRFKNSILYKTRKWNPEYPGIFDYSIFTVGYKYCNENDPKCNNCILKNICDKRI